MMIDMNRGQVPRGAPPPTPPRNAAGLPLESETAMFREAAESARVIADQFSHNQEAARDLGARLRARPPRAVVTCARGSSDHAATFAKYLIETRAGVLTASAALSVSSIYGARQDLRDCLFLAISQSGKSPDLLAATDAARAAGAVVVALVNSSDTPLAELAHFCLPLCAGPETSVAATKSYLATLAALVHMVSEWRGDSKLAAALAAAPEGLDAAWQLDWSAALPTLVRARHLYVIGRGIGLGIAQEAALKCKETCALHAEAFSGAEVRHGPQALLQAAFPALVLAQRDETHSGVEALCRDLVSRPVDVLAAGASVAGAVNLPTVAAHPVIEPLLLVQSFYRLANRLAIERGQDPDSPPNLRKITETL